MSSLDAPSRPRPSRSFRPLLPGVIPMCVVLALLQLQPPARDATDGFSTELALAHLRVISREPHPLGSPENDAVRRYLLEQFEALGLEVTAQRAHVRRRDGSVLPLVNVIARLPGTQPGQAVMLAAHYDSVSAGPGAGDDGAAVAALLEVARLLVIDPQPRRQDVIFLMTDGEEAGLLGARAYVDALGVEHIGVLLNFEARGTSGPSIMFETGPGHDWLIKQYARVAPHPVATSLSHEVYRHMPNDTDFTVFREAGAVGLNFAFIGSPQHYHTAGDTLENLDTRSLRHHGRQALALVRHLANTDLSTARGGADLTYFSLPGGLVARYPLRWATPLAILPLVVAGVLLVVGLRFDRMRVARLLWSGVCCLLGAALTSAALYALRELCSGTGLWMHPNGAVAGFCLTAAGLWTGVQAALQRRLGAENLAVTAVTLVAAAGMLCALWFPAAGYLLALPALSATTGLGSFVRRAHVPQPGWLLMLSGIPAVFLMTPVIYLCFLALGPQLPHLLGLLVVLLMWLLTPQLAVLPPAARRLLPVLLGIGAALSFVAAMASS